MKLNLGSKLWFFFITTLNVVVFVPKNDNKFCICNMDQFFSLVKHGKACFFFFNHRCIKLLKSNRKFLYLHVNVFFFQNVTKSTTLLVDGSIWQTFFRLVFILYICLFLFAIFYFSSCIATLRSRIFSQLFYSEENNRIWDFLKKLVSLSLRVWMNEDAEK